MIKVRKILHLLLLAILPVVLSVVTARAQIYPGQTTQLSVEQKPGDTYTWDIYNVATVNFAVTNGTAVSDGDAAFVGGNTGASVSVTWLKPGTYYFKVTAVNACTNNLKIGRLVVEEALPTAVLDVDPDSVCVGAWANLTVTFTGEAPWSFKLRIKDAVTQRDTVYTNIGSSQNPFVIPVGPKITTEYTVIEVTDMNGTQTNPSEMVELKVNPLPRSSRIYVKNE